MQKVVDLSYDGSTSAPKKYLSVDHYIALVSTEHSLNHIKNLPQVLIDRPNVLMLCATKNVSV